MAATVGDPEPGKARFSNDPEPGKATFREQQEPQECQIVIPRVNWSRLWYPNPPSFMAYMRQEWPDFLSIAILLIIPLIVIKRARPAATLYFSLQDPSIAYPLEAEYINTALSGALSLGIPFLIIKLISVFLVGSFWDANSALKGLGFSLTTANMFQLPLKFLIGGLRPNFLDVCNPVPTYPGTGPLKLYYTTEICTNSDTRAIYDAMISFPSGHCAAAFAGFFYLFLYLNAKFKVLADYRSYHWQQVLLLVPLLAATLFAMSKRADYWHHDRDILVGSAIGVFWAWMSYRQVYCAVWDWRFNHVPAPYKSMRERAATVAFPTKDLTAIDFAGWRNRYSKEREEKEMREARDLEAGKIGR